MARQSVEDKLSDTLILGRIDKMEKQLEGVETLTDTLEAMIGRMTATKELLHFEASQIKAIEQMLKRMSETVSTAPPQSNGHPVAQKAKDRGIEEEMVALQTLIGVQSPENVTKIQLKGIRMEKELFESNFGNVRSTLNETYCPFISWC